MSVFSSNAITSSMPTNSWDWNEPELNTKHQTGTGMLQMVACDTASMSVFIKSLATLWSTIKYYNIFLSVLYLIALLPSRFRFCREPWCLNLSAIERCKSGPFSVLIDKFIDKRNDKQLLCLEVLRSREQQLVHVDQSDMWGHLWNSWYFTAVSCLLVCAIQMSCWVYTYYYACMCGMLLWGSNEATRAASTSTL